MYRAQGITYLIDLSYTNNLFHIIKKMNLESNIYFPMYVEDLHIDSNGSKSSTSFNANLNLFRDISL